jgi:hypothetical protein
MNHKLYLEQRYEKLLAMENQEQLTEIVNQLLILNDTLAAIFVLAVTALFILVFKYIYLTLLKIMVILCN